jgi:hypothetical protein
MNSFQWWWCRTIAWRVADWRRKGLRFIEDWFWGILFIAVVILFLLPLAAACHCLENGHFEAFPLAF